ncbi:MAG TPA: TetR/AcrR family transcriptional regulator [Acidimicrobiia bacterium]|nr:TetR/AcrR family transcriptional regulator [Acidimicrobiia bacterium]
MAPSTPVEEVDPGEDRRSQLVRTVYRVMARDGVHRVPLQQIADAAGVSKGLLLYHFNTKDAMVLEAMNWVLEATAARIRSRLDAADDPGQRLTALVDAIWIGPEANRDFFRFYLDGVEFQARTPGFAEFGERGRKIIEGLYRDVISDGMQSGSFAVGDPDESAVQMRAVIEGCFLQWLQTSDWRDNHISFKRLCLDALNRVLHTPSPAV